MARNQNRKQTTQLNSPAEEETTSVRRARPAALLAGSEVPEAVGSSVAFHSDGALGDAGAEFAEDFGRDFLMAATSGEDIGEMQSASSADASELGEPFLHVTDELEDLTEYAELVDDDPTPPATRSN